MTLKTIVTRSIVFVVMLTFVTKVQLDFIELFSTLHTTNFLWVLGDFMNDPKCTTCTPWAIRFDAFIFITLMGFVTFRMWMKGFEACHTFVWTDHVLPRLKRKYPDFFVEKKEDDECKVCDCNSTEEFCTDDCACVKEDSCKCPTCPEYCAGDCVCPAEEPSK